ncbi:hypothetical protein PR202_gb12825 [Eleusine coracana subsp. coracana]|uniref:F-box domain-containing protein n=1 Tax=Eleusine coracana subsp. coracana TaxID=191504 RepID=A0AAV5ER09_ELECO|nr:hypothetical protein PR202_gb12825 [Eleusine coracana subsp. coracana]
MAILVAATVVAVAGGGGGTGRRSFRLIGLFFYYRPTRLTASVYSSDSGDWVDSVATLFVPSTISFIQSPSTLVGNAIYWLLNDAKTIIQFDLESQSLASVEQPRRGRGHADVDRRRHAFPDHSRLIVPADNGYFGLAILSERSIKFWERETQLSGAATWLLRRTVQLDRVLADLELEEQTSPLRIVGFAEENNVIFVSADDCIFMIHVESMQFKKVKIEISHRRLNAMTRRRRHPLPENDDLLAEILLCLPPHPSSLPHAGLVCKRWRRLIIDPHFVRRFSARHQTPPLLGFFRTLDDEAQSRLPASQFSLRGWRGRMPTLNWTLFDCRHRLVLYGFAPKFRITEFVVTNPMTGHRRRILNTEHDDRVVAAAVVAAEGEISFHRSFRLVVLLSPD